MSLLNSHSAVFHRYAQASKDALGNVSRTTEMSGFPVTARGYYEPSGGSGSRKPEGLSSHRDAIFLSETFLLGRVGDIVTFKGTNFTVVSVDDQRQAVGRPHFEYGLLRIELANRAKLNASDTVPLQS